MQTLADVLRPLPQGQLQLGRGLNVATNEKSTVFRGTVRGQPAVIKQRRLSSLEEALPMAAEVCCLAHHCSTTLLSLVRP